MRSVSAAENVAVVRRFIEEVVNRKELDVINEIFAEDVVHHLAGRETRGREALREGEEGYRRAFPDETVTIMDVVAEGDKVAVRWSWKGTHAGEFAGHAPTGKLVETEGIQLHRLDDGEIAEIWEYYDQASFRRQLSG